MKHDGRHAGFTLLELLVIIAIIAVLLSILLPSLRKCRRMCERIACQSNLRQVMIGWGAYFLDNEDKFLRGVNVNHTFGGWEGTSGAAYYRPLNPYLNLQPQIRSETPSTVFTCPSDKGGVLGCPDWQTAYNYYGNSYQTNIITVGPTRLPDTTELFTAINAKLDMLESFKVSQVEVPLYKLCFIGDNNWWDQIEPSVPPGKIWHHRPGHFNIAFLDGHAALIEIEEETYETDDYTVVPFRNLP